MKIHYFCKEGFPVEDLASGLAAYEFVHHQGTVQDFPDLSDESADVLAVFVVSKVDAAVMDRFPNVKLITTLSTGFGHIDLEEARKRGITVCNVPVYGAQTVAEHAFALLLTISRKVYRAYDQVEETGSFSQEELRGFDLEGKTIGVIGTGNIGAHSCKIAHGFGMKILAFDINQHQELVDSYGLQYVSLDELLAQSDIISLHVPYNEHTHHLLNKENMPNIKKGAYLINTSRGCVVETEALVSALESGVLAGAGLDVLEEEGILLGDEETSLLHEEHPGEEKLKTMLANHYLIDHPHVIITPHIAFNTHEAVERIVVTTVENIEEFQSGKPQNVVS